MLSVRFRSSCIKKGTWIREKEEMTDQVFFPFALPINSVLTQYLQRTREREESSERGTEFSLANAKVELM